MKMMIFVQDFEIISDIISTFERNNDARTAFLPGLALKSHFRKRHHHSGFLQVGVFFPGKNLGKKFVFSRLIDFKEVIDLSSDFRIFCIVYYGLSMVKTKVFKSPDFS